MKLFINRYQTKILSFFIVLALILIGTIAVVFEIWNVMHPDLRGKVLLTAFTFCISILLLAAANIAFLDATEDPPPPPFDEKELSGWQDRLHKAKEQPEPLKPGSD